MEKRTDDTLIIQVTRHGESDRNAGTNKAINGDTSLHEKLVSQRGENWHLTAEGRTEAMKCGKILRKLGQDNPDAAYTSNLSRCVETADLLGLSTKWIKTEAIRERRWGDPRFYKGLPFEKYRKYFEYSGELDWRPPAPGSETIRERYEVVKPFLLKVIEKHLGGNVILCTHGGVMRAIQMVLEQRTAGNFSDMPKHPSGNCCIWQFRLSEIDLEKKRWKTEFRSLTPESPLNEEWQNA